MNENEQAIHSRINRAIAELKGWRFENVEKPYSKDFYHIYAPDGVQKGHEDNGHWSRVFHVHYFCDVLPHWTTNMNAALKLLAEIDGVLAWDVTRWKITRRDDGHDIYTCYTRDAMIGICEVWLNAYGVDINKLIIEGAHG